MIIAQNEVLKCPYSCLSVEDPHPTQVMEVKMKQVTPERSNLTMWQWKQKQVLNQTRSMQKNGKIGGLELKQLKITDWIVKKKCAQQIHPRKKIYATNLAAANSIFRVVMNKNWRRRGTKTGGSAQMLQYCTDWMIFLLVYFHFSWETYVESCHDSRTSFYWWTITPSCLRNSVTLCGMYWKPKQ